MAYSELGYLEGTLPIAEQMHNQVLSIPIGPHLTIEESRLIKQAISNAFTHICN
jgi:dTDP-4-amino-4,6-dideoxygalactose transaminase